MKALIVVDIQNDFLPGGALAVKDGDQIIPVVNELMAKFDLVVATKDWHPADHESFASNHPGKQVGDVIELNGIPQVLWPDHCVQDTAGAEFADNLEVDLIQKIFYKGTDPAIDSYSGFFDNSKEKDTGLASFLKSNGILQVFIIGLATDYCVKYTALDAKGIGFITTVILDAVKAVNLNPEDEDLAIASMKKSGVLIMHRYELAV
jgi:nicotinamidase/pyrazinamidase